mgnify:CR=1 FL=1|tara:strand:- start:153265 stop:153426 length:162 start_codon:yes stop_codon:yes gene_type:complete
MEEKKELRAYKEESYPPYPTKATKFWRRNFIYQFFKFWQLNYKIMRIVVKGHT